MSGHGGGSHAPSGGNFFPEVTLGKNIAAGVEALSDTLDRAGNRVSGLIQGIFLKTRDAVARILREGPSAVINIPRPLLKIIDKTVQKVTQLVTWNHIKGFEPTKLLLNQLERTWSMLINAGFGKGIKWDKSREYGWRAWLKRAEETVNEIANRKLFTDQGSHAPHSKGGHDAGHGGSGDHKQKPVEHIVHAKEEPKKDHAHGHGGH